MKSITTAAIRHILTDILAKLMNYFVELSEKDIEHNLNVAKAYCRGSKSVKRIFIINADDFGLNERTNAAIISSFERGICSSTTIMANMPGFDEACRLVHERKVGEHVGIHFVLTEGAPLTEDIKECSRFCGHEGRFNGRRHRIFRLRSFEEKTLIRELSAQVAKCRLHGIRVTHADSHNHIHEEWAIASVIMRVCVDQNIPHLRLARNCGAKAVPLINRTYRHLLNLRLRHAKLARTKYFGGVSDYTYLCRRIGIEEAKNSIEVMIHPTYDAAGALVDLGSGRRLEEIEIGLNERLHAVSYSGHQYGK